MASTESGFSADVVVPADPDRGEPVERHPEPDSTLAAENYDTSDSTLSGLPDLSREAQPVDLADQEYREVQSAPNAARADDPPIDNGLDELVLPSLVSAPEPLPPGATVGPEGRVRVVAHSGTRGRINRYAATWRDGDGREIEVELREAPADHAGLAREAEILTQLSYAMLPRSYLACTESSRCYLALDRLEGQTLEQSLEAGLPVDQALSILVQLVQVVRRLHRAGWALLSLTPSDVVLGQPLRIGQLGQAGRIGEPPAQALHVAGYSAPELAYREIVTGKEDVFTLGAILYRALAGLPLPESGFDVSDLSDVIRLPGAPQLLAELLAPADERLDIETLYQRLLDLKTRQVTVSVSLEVASATTLGLNPTRFVNEDSCVYAVWARTGANWVGETAVLCVADGMGGMEAGEVASQTAITVVMRAATSTLWPPTEEERPAGPPAEPAESSLPVIRGMHGWSGGPDGPDVSAMARPDPVALVRQAATAVHASAHGRNLGTTMTCVVVQDGDLTLGHVGDTRAYLLRNGTLTRLTADHSLVAAMVASGVITADEARGHPDSNKVLRSLGSQRELPDGYVDDLSAAFGSASLRLEVDDRLLLCSDGVWGTVEDTAIQVTLTEALDAQNAARALIDQALAAGAPDNATAIVARCVQRPVL